MERAADIPPIINAPRRSFAPAVALGIVVALAISARVSSYLHVVFPPCVFKTIVGIPCAFCGGTRALRAVAEFRWVDAFWWNPLVTIGAAVAVLWFVMWAVSPTRVMDRWRFAARAWPVVAIGFALLALNWIFVVIFLPR